MNGSVNDGDGDDDEDDGKDREHEHQSIQGQCLSECFTDPGQDSSKTKVLKGSG